MIIFILAIMVPSDNYAKYVSNSLPHINEFVPNFMRNLIKYYNLVFADFKLWWLFVVLLIIVGFICTVVWKSEQKKSLSLIISVTAVICMGLVCFGMYPALELPLFRARAMYGFCVFVTLLGVSVVKDSKKMVVNIPVIILSWTYFVFAFTYGNALSIQKEYTEFRISQVIEDLNDLDILQNNKEVVVQIDGDIGSSPILEAMPQDYQMLNRLIPSMFNGSGEGYGSFQFFNYYDLKNVVKLNDLDLTTYNLPLIEDHMYHTFYGNDEYLLIELK
jgi:hypothetical protein